MWRSVCEVYHGIGVGIRWPSPHGHHISKWGFIRWLKRRGVVGSGSHCKAISPFPFKPARSPFPFKPLCDWPWYRDVNVGHLYHASQKVFGLWYWLACYFCLTFNLTIAFLDRPGGTTWLEKVVITVLTFVWHSLAAVHHSTTLHITICWRFYPKRHAII